jgi:predicted aspartyl protease
MTHGGFRDGFPRISLNFPLVDGGARAIEFIVDSGFEGDFSLPPDLLSGLDAAYAGEYPIALADLTYRTRPLYQTLVIWQGEERVTEVIAMDGNPLIGLGILQGNSVYMEITHGGRVEVEPL